MNSERLQPPPLAVFLLRHFYPKDNREVLIGDLLEGFREGRSVRWFWRQVLIALLAGASKEFWVHWPQICFAVLGTLVVVLESWVMRKPAIERLWALGISAPWPLSTAYDFGFRAVLGALMLQPLLAAVLLLGRTFSWDSLLRTFSLSVLLLASSEIGLFLLPNLPSSAYRPPPPTFQDFLIDVLESPRPFLMVVSFVILLISASVGCATSVRLRRIDRHRGGGHPPTPATPPCVRVRTRRFES